jgi:hypothetical protein
MRKQHFSGQRLRDKKCRPRELVSMDGTWQFAGNLSVIMLQYLYRVSGNGEFLIGGNDHYLYF